MKNKLLAKCIAWVLANLIAGAVVLGLLTLMSCTANRTCHRIQRLSTKHPDCFKAMTETKTDTGSAKVADRDSSVRKADSALTGLSDTVNKYMRLLADCNSTPGQKQKATTAILSVVEKTKSVVKHLLTTAPCIKDTLTFTDSKGAILKLWQSGDQIKYSLTYPTLKYELKETGWPWWVWLLIGIACGVAIAFVGLVWLARTG